VQKNSKEEMEMKIKSLFTIIMIFVILASTSVLLQATTADSSTWLYQQNGTMDSTTDFTITRGFADAGSGILDYSDNAEMVALSWAGESASLISNGYTIEMRLQIASNGADGFGFGIMPGDGNQLAWFGVRPGDVFNHFGPGGVVSQGGGDNTDAFHVFRIAHAPSASTFSIWKDGSLLTDSAAVITYSGAFVNIGVVSQHAGTGQLDYLRWTTGVYAPPTPTTVPEPSSLVVLASGLLGAGGFIIRRRK
jgi:hypothetical protein